MANLNKLLCRVALLLVLSSTACKKNPKPIEPDKPTTPTTPTKPVIPEGPKPSAKVYIPLTLQSEQDKIELKYTDDGVQLTEVKYASGIREVITYKDNYPKEYRRYDKEEFIYMVDYILNADKLVIKGNRFEVRSNGRVLIPAGYYEISYNDQKMYSSINWFDFKNNLLSNQQFAYNANYSLSGIVTTDKKPFACTYSYDDKPGILKSVQHAQLFFIEHDHFLFLNTKSNLTTVKNEKDASENKVISSEYNADGYPTSYTINTGQTKALYKITYR